MHVIASSGIAWLVGRTPWALAGGLLSFVAAGTGNLVEQGLATAIFLVLSLAQWWVCRAGLPGVSAASAAIGAAVLTGWFVSLVFEWLLDAPLRDL